MNFANFRGSLIESLMTHIYDQNYSSRPQIDVGDIFDLVGSKMTSRKLL